MTCSLCPRRVLARGLCRRHYQSERKAGRLPIKQPHKAPDGRRIAGNGYVYLYRPDHPLAHADGYVAEHRAIAWHAGELTDPTHHVHHVNGDKTDNRIENLEAITNSEHGQEHARERGITNQHGSFPALAAIGAECSVEGCSLNVAASAMCSAHATRHRRYGDPLVVRRVTSTTATPYRLEAHR